MAPWGRRAAPPANRCAQRPPPPRPWLRARLRPRPAWHGAPPLREARVLKCPGPDCDASWPGCKGRKVPGEPDKAVMPPGMTPQTHHCAWGAPAGHARPRPCKLQPCPPSPGCNSVPPTLERERAMPRDTFTPPKCCHRRLEPEQPLVALPSGVRIRDPLCDGGVRGEASKWDAGSSTLAFPPSCLYAEPNQQVP